MDRQAPERRGPALLTAATVILVVADAVVASTPAPPLVDGCSTPHINVVAPVLLGLGGLVVALALVARMVAVPSRIGYPNRRWTLFHTILVFVTLGYAASALVMYVASHLSMCF